MVDIVKQGKALYLGISRWHWKPCSLLTNIRRSTTSLLIFQADSTCSTMRTREWNLRLLRRKRHRFHLVLTSGTGTSHRPISHGIPADSRMAKEHFLKHSARTPELLEQLKKWNAEAGERDETLAEMALAWILQQKGVTSDW